MKVTILGSGNVAEVLALAVSSNSESGISAGELWSRSERGKELASQYGFSFCGEMSRLAPADLYIAAVSDNAVSEITRKIEIPANSVVVHTAGGIGIEAISAHIANRGVLYPLQTFSSGRRVDMRDVPIFIEYTTPRAKDTIADFANIISGQVNEADSDLRVHLHTAAVFAGNFTNHLYALGEKLMDERGLSFDILKPLIAETAAKALESSDPVKVQTGPALRGDSITMDRHLKLLRKENDKRYEKIYKLLSKSIWETSKKI